MFVYYVSGEIDRVGYDTDGDGKAESWDHDAARRARIALGKRRAKWRTAGDGAGESEGYVEESGKKEEAAPAPAEDSKKGKSKGKGGTASKGSSKGSSAASAEDKKSAPKSEEAKSAGTPPADPPPPAEIKKPKQNP